MKKKEIYKYNQIKIDKKYRGKVVAYYKGKIIASGKTLDEVEKKVSDKKRKIFYGIVPKENYIIV